MTMRADLVEVVIGVDTHTAAVVDARTGGVPARATVTADPDGDAETTQDRTAAGGAADAPDRSPRGRGAAATGQRQLLAMVITAPESVRARFRGQSTRAMIATAGRLRPAPPAQTSRSSPRSPCCVTWPDGSASSRPKR